MAIKVEKIKKKKMLFNLKNSALVYKLLRDQSNFFFGGVHFNLAGFGKIYWYGKQGCHNFLIHEYLGTNLKELQEHV